MGVLDDAKFLQSRKRTDRLLIPKQKKIKGATYKGKDPVDGTDIVQVDGDEPVSGFRMLSNKSVSTGDRVSLRPSKGGLQRADAKNVKPKVDEVLAEKEVVIIVEALVTFISFFFYSGSSRLSFPYSDVTAGSTNGGDNPLTYVFAPLSGRLKKRSGILALIVSNPSLPQDPDNSILVGTTAIQNFGSESGYDEVGAQIVGSFIDHTGNTGGFTTGTTAYFELGLKFSLTSQKYLKKWDSVDGVEPILIIDKKIIALDKALNSNKRAELLTYLIETKAMQPLIDQALGIIAQIQEGNQFFGRNSEIAIQKILDQKLATVPSASPEIASTDEFFLLSPNMDLMKTALQNFITNAGIGTEFALSTATVKCTPQKERADALQAFIVQNNFSPNYFASTSFQPTLRWFYSRQNWTTIPDSPIDLELDFEGVPWTFSYDVGFSRIENEGYFLSLSVEASNIPFGASQYDVRYRWRKRGNTDWFSI